MPLPTLFRVVVLVLGPGLLCLGLLVLAVTARRRAQWVRTTGAVVGRQLGGTDGNTPVIRFTTQGGRVVEGPQLPSVDIGIYPSGDATVWYDPTRPERFSAQVAWFDRPGLVLLAFATIFSVMALVVLTH